MFRLLSLVAFTALLLLVLCGAGSHKAPAHIAQLDRLELPPAISNTAALEATPQLTAAIASIVSLTRCAGRERRGATPPEFMSLRDPLTVSCVLRV